MARLSAHLVVALASPTEAGAWRESRYPYGQFGVDSPEIEHHGFAIGQPRMTPSPTDRQQGQILATTTVIVAWAHRVRAEAAVLDTRAAYRAEAELIAAVRSTPSNPRLKFDLVDVARRPSRDGLVFVGETSWSVSHLYPLQR